MTDVTISGRDVMERCTLRVVFRPRRSFRFRVRIAAGLMRLAAMALGCNGDVTIQLGADDGAP